MPSTAIAGASYDPRTAVLRLCFVGGGTYEYLDVPQAVFAAFVRAPSKGRFVNRVIKPGFVYRRLDGPQGSDPGPMEPGSTVQR